MRGAVNRFEKNLDWRVVERASASAQERHEGRDFPQTAETMAGHLRLDNVRRCIASVLHDGVAGDLIETGCALARRHVDLHARGARRARRPRTGPYGSPTPSKDCRLAAADAHPVDREYDLDGFSGLAVGLDQVRANFAKYGLLDEHVRFLAGWFKDTLATAPIELSLRRRTARRRPVRVDDRRDHRALSETIDRRLPDRRRLQRPLVPRTPVVRRSAITRAQHAIREPIQTIDWTGVYWRRER